MPSVPSTAPPPCILHEDEHLLVVVKPAGWNTHAPHPHAGEGIFDWLKHREPRWSSLAIIHRLDKDTSGVMVFGKSPLANRSLTAQFTSRTVRKKYLLLTDRDVPSGVLTVASKLARAGDRQVSGPRGEAAETNFELIGAVAQPVAANLVAGMPLTGRTHQIRVHAADRGFPILGDTLYGGTPHTRVCLHAAELSFQHPETGAMVTFQAPPDFATDARRTLREAIIDGEATTAFRVLHGASDGHPGWFVERLGDYILSQSEAPWSSTQRDEIDGSASALGIYHKILSRQVRRTSPAEASPRRVSGQTAPDRFTVRENGVSFELSFDEGYSVGLFLDQRDNRRRLLTGHIAAGFPLAGPPHDRPHPELHILNTFAYTCGFSVCAALNGARTTSLDLAQKYLEWGKRNFELNGLDPGQHDFIYGDAFDWLRRLAKKDRQYDAVLLDPPTFSQSRARGIFRAEKDYGRLVGAALPVLKSGGLLFAATNAAGLAPEAFLAALNAAVQDAGRSVEQVHYVPQPPDFPVSRDERAYLKTVWLRVA